MSDNIPRDPVIGEGAPQTEQSAINAELRHTIGFGFDMEAFKKSAAGQYMSARANAELKNLHIQLEDFDLTEDESRKIRMKIRCCIQWAEWLEEAIAEGEAAQQQAIARGVL